MSGRAGLGLLILLVLVAHHAIGQLAITEVMPAPRENTNTHFLGAEYWELTNFGTNDIDLTGYGFRDSNLLRGLQKSVFVDLVIRGSESVIFYRIDNKEQHVQDPATFRAWWGDANLPADLRCVSWEGSPKFSGWDGDEVRLYDAGSNLVDTVQFARGRAFTYSPENGLFGVFSVPGVGGAFTAAQADDVGSPGTTTGPVPAFFLQEPSDHSTDQSADAIFTTSAGGMPSPRYEWYAHDAIIPGATNSVLVVSNVQPGDAGEYYVRIANFFSATTSQVATLFVNTNPGPPRIISPPADASVFIGQTAVFSVAARGLPSVQYQWSANGEHIPGATGPRLEIHNPPEGVSGTRYNVRVSNESGSTNVSAVLYVTARFDLRFTEVMPLPSEQEDNRHFDWFEVTNFDTNAVDLLGWRFSDEPSFEQAIVITNSVVVHPGRSVIFAERLNRALFARWWGTDSLPEDLEVFTYSGMGLGGYGETLFLWNPAATDSYDYLAVLSWAAATPGVSFECERVCEPGFGCEDQAVATSAPGVKGAFAAEEGGHIGSPGYRQNPPIEILAIEPGGDRQVQIRCRVVAGQSYHLVRKAALDGNSWTRLSGVGATNNVVTLTDQAPVTGSTWFYRVEQTP